MAKFYWIGQSITGPSGADATNTSHPGGYSGATAGSLLWKLTEEDPTSGISWMKWELQCTGDPGVSFGGETACIDGTTASPTGHVYYYSDLGFGSGPLGHYWNEKTNWLMFVDDDITGHTGATAQGYYTPATRFPHGGDDVVFKRLERDPIIGIDEFYPKSPCVYGGMLKQGDSLQAEWHGSAGTTNERRGKLNSLLIEKHWWGGPYASWDPEIRSPWRHGSPGGQSDPYKAVYDRPGHWPLATGGAYEGGYGDNGISAISEMSGLIRKPNSTEDYKTYSEIVNNNSGHFTNDQDFALYKNPDNRIYGKNLYHYIPKWEPFIWSPTRSDEWLSNVSGPEYPNPATWHKVRNRSAFHMSMVPQHVAEKNAARIGTLASSEYGFTGGLVVATDYLENWDNSLYSSFGEGSTFGNAFINTQSPTYFTKCLFDNCILATDLGSFVDAYHGHYGYYWTGSIYQEYWTNTLYPGAYDRWYNEWVHSPYASQRSPIGVGEEASNPENMREKRSYVPPVTINFDECNFNDSLSVDGNRPGRIIVKGVTANEIPQVTIRGIWRDEIDLLTPLTTADIYPVPREQTLRHMRQYDHVDHSDSLDWPASRYPAPLGNENFYAVWPGHVNIARPGQKSHTISTLRMPENWGSQGYGASGPIQGFYGATDSNKVIIDSGVTMSNLVLRQGSWEVGNCPADHEITVVDGQLDKYGYMRCFHRTNPNWAGFRLGASPTADAEEGMYMLSTEGGEIHFQTGMYVIANYARGTTGIQQAVKLTNYPGSGWPGTHR